MPTGIYERKRLASQILLLRAQDRFWSYVEKTETCWLWRGSLTGSGYGKYGINGETILAHRYSYEFFKGEIPEGEELDHLCRVRRCVNPEHLEAVSRRENIRRGLTAADNFMKTHCPKGHPLTLGNLRGYELKHGQRSCLACNNDRNRKARGEETFNSK